MRRTRAALGVAAAVGAVVVAVSGGSDADPRTPSALPGLPTPFLGTTVVGSGGRTAAVDAYGDVVDLRGPGPAGVATVAVAAESQATGKVDPETATVARARFGGSRPLPLWRADSVRQRYLPGTNVLRTVARLDGDSAVVVRGIGGAGAARADRRWISKAQPLGPTAPAWARRLYTRSLLVLRALTDRRTGAVAAGARDGWAYVWPRDAAAVAIAFASAGYRGEARRVTRFLLRLDLDAAARFRGTGEPVEGREAQGDAAGWVKAAAQAAGMSGSAKRVIAQAAPGWRDRADYQEKSPGDYLANAIASTDGPKSLDMGDFSAHRRIAAMFGTPRGLVRRAGEADSGLDSAAAWAVVPFPHPVLYPLVRRTLLRLAADAGPFGIAPSQDWPEEDPWTAPTAWTAWSLAALGERHAALKLMAALRRAATPLDMLPERVDARSGMPRSTTPLAWSHAFAILALRELWP